MFIFLILHYIHYIYTVSTIYTIFIARRATPFQRVWPARLYSICTVNTIMHTIAYHSINTHVFAVVFFFSYDCILCIFNIDNKKCRRHPSITIPCLYLWARSNFEKGKEARDGCLDHSYA